MLFKQIVTHNLLNIPGWRTKRKIVVIESDDWGSIRMPSRDIYEKLLAEGYRVDLNKYERNDSIATEEDLDKLFDILSKYRDINGNHPIVTANCVVANPDFDKIKASNFQKYYYEPFTKTLKRYRNCEHSFELWEQGMYEGLFKPQFHGREHLNVARWMNFLQTDADTRHVFDYGLMGLFPKGDNMMNHFQVALDDCIYKGQSICDRLIEGLDLFESLFKYRSKTFIAPCYTWNPLVEKSLFNHGIIGIQGMVYQYNPGEKCIRHWQGTRNRLGQIYTIRNCFFEPTICPNLDSVSDCLYRIKCAFRWRKPAIISSHRINFIGSIHEENRNKNLRKFDNLLSRIIHQWPDVEFMSSDQLIELMQ